MAAFVKELQAEIVRSLEEVENEGCLERGETETRFLVDEWKRPEGGDGVSCVLQDGKVFQKAGVLVSVVYGTLPEAAVKQMRSERSKDLKGDGPFPFFAAGISLVVHPRNPFAPTVHLNYRYFEIEDEETGEATLWWFGGGTDLTPAYLFEEDAEHFHATIKRACDANSPRYYPEFKEWCDRYFYLPHRKECRGVGGIFYDDQAGDGTLADRERLFALARDCGRAFVPSYVPIVRRRKDMPYTEENLRWQQLRRGRYVEFNLVQDRGTKFGLTTVSKRIKKK
ncbi:MAG: Coproporphyrinogen III oxidase [Olpidium bornovanus]|uniref:coproporphyrinogen oxidase n=1 Tax=Olpidium bornovanus TaxID=278681 RepID=A0A8H7ZQU3_9FUNG|nr:MAG: Coproporphyrinogen III oxidase [Olpidium bornovanus]